MLILDLNNILTPHFFHWYIERGPYISFHMNISIYFVNYGSKSFTYNILCRDVQHISTIKLFLNIMRITKFAIDDLQILTHTVI